MQLFRPVSVVKFQDKRVRLAAANTGMRSKIFVQPPVQLFASGRRVDDRPALVALRMTPIMCRAVCFAAHFTLGMPKSPRLVLVAELGFGLFQTAIAARHFHILVPAHSRIEQAYYTHCMRKMQVVGEEGFEPPTSSV